MPKTWDANSRQFIMFEEELLPYQEQLFQMYGASLLTLLETCLIRHTLRKEQEHLETCAISGVSIHIQLLLGHTQESTTRGYVHVERIAELATELLAREIAAGERRVN